MMADFNPDEYLASTSGFDPDKYLASPAIQAPPSKLESFTRGAAQGATLNFAPSIAGAGETALDVAKGKTDLAGLLEAYRKHRGESEANFQAAEKQNPWSYGAGNVTGAVLSPVNEVIPGGGLVKTVAGGALYGGAAALGQSKHDLTNPTMENIYGAAKDVGQGAMLGAAGGAVGSAIGSAASNLAPKKVASFLLGAPEESVERYIANPQAVKTAPSLTESVGNVKNSLENIKQKAIAGSQEARGALSGGGIGAAEGEGAYRGSDIAKYFKDKIGEIVKRSEGALSPTDASTVKYLENQAAPFEALGDKPVSGSRVKDVIQDLDRKVSYNAAPGEFASPDERAIKAVRSNMDVDLKTIYPEYAEKMKDVAANSELLDRVSGMANSDQGLMNTLNRVRRERAPFAEQDLAAIDAKYGTNHVEDLKNALAREAFEKGAAGPGGSRNVQLYSKVFGDAAKQLHLPMGEATGAMLGAGVDKFGPGMARAGIDTYRAIADNPYVQNYGAGISGMMSKLPVSPSLPPALEEYLVRKYGNK